MSETDLMRRIQVAASNLGARLLRNNVGQLKDRKGKWVRYGLGNPGGADLIGWTPVRITPDMVGRTVAIFTALEVKDPDGTITDEQVVFLAAVQGAGGFAGMARSVTEATDFIERAWT